MARSRCDVYVLFSAAGECGCSEEKTSLLRLHKHPLAFGTDALWPARLPEVILIILSENSGLYSLKTTRNLVNIWLSFSKWWLSIFWGLTILSMFGHENFIGLELSSLTRHMILTLFPCGTHAHANMHPSVMLISSWKVGAVCPPCSVSVMKTIEFPHVWFKKREPFHATASSGETRRGTSVRNLRFKGRSQTDILTQLGPRGRRGAWRGRTVGQLPLNGETKIMSSAMKYNKFYFDEPEGANFSSIGETNRECEGARLVKVPRTRSRLRRCSRADQPEWVLVHLPWTSERRLKLNSRRRSRGKESALGGGGDQV